MLGNPGDAAQDRLQFDHAVADARVAVPEVPAHPLGQTTIETQLREGQLVLSATAQVHADPPEKASSRVLIMEPTPAVSGLLAALRVLGTRW